MELTSSGQGSVKSASRGGLTTKRTWSVNHSNLGRGETGSFVICIGPAMLCPAGYLPPTSSLSCKLLVSSIFSTAWGMAADREAVVSSGGWLSDPVTVSWLRLDWPVRASGPGAALHRACP